ncbi:MAG: HU family DNA-binding protein [Candidatus Campbellbacteria bacterium]|nr:HU family DNA-binding protein [Candidatus Campbellbacteria bacterium]
MNKALLVEQVSEECGCSKAEAERLVNFVFSTIMDSVVKGDEVAIAGFGAFVSKARAARMGRNPKTGESIKIAASRVVKFRVAKPFKEAVAKK